MILQASNNSLSSISSSIEQQSSFVPKTTNTNVSSRELASASLNPSVNVELSSSTVAVSAIPPVYSKPTVYAVNESQLSPSRSTSSSDALAENAILSKPSGSSPKDISSENPEDASKKGLEQQNTESKTATGVELSEDELKMIEELKARDLEVRAHEQAHKAVGGQYTGAISFSYQAGPDGKRYAVGGEVPIDVTPIAGDPQATITKMTIVSAAATAPAQPSAQDQMVAAQAARMISEAQAELAQQKYEDVNVDNDSRREKTNSDSASDSDSKDVYAINSLEKIQSISQKESGQINLVDIIV